MGKRKQPPLPRPPHRIINLPFSEDRFVLAKTVQVKACACTPHQATACRVCSQHGPTHRCLGANLRFVRATLSGSRGSRSVRVPADGQQPLQRCADQKPRPEPESHGLGRKASGVVVRLQLTQLRLWRRQAGRQGTEYTLRGKRLADALSQARTSARRRRRGGPASASGT